jgi:hypothetical protein
LGGSKSRENEFAARIRSRKAGAIRLADALQSADEFGPFRQEPPSFEVPWAPEFHLDIPHALSSGIDDLTGNRGSRRHLDAQILQLIARSNSDGTAGNRWHALTVLSGEVLGIAQRDKVIVRAWTDVSNLESAIRACCGCVGKNFPVTFRLAHIDGDETPSCC